MYLPFLSLPGASTDIGDIAVAVLKLLMIHCLKRSHKFPTSALLLGKEKSQFAE
jgi:hypothetical protein